MTFLTLLVVFVAREKSQASWAYTSELTNSSHKTAKGSIKETSVLHQIQHITLGQESSGESSKSKPLNSSVTTDKASNIGQKPTGESNKLKPLNSPMTIGESSNIGQESSEESSKSKPLNSSVTTDKASNIGQKPTGKSNKLKLLNSPMTIGESSNIGQESSEESSKLKLLTDKASNIDQESSGESSKLKPLNSPMTIGESSNIDQEPAKENSKEELPPMLGDKGSSRWYIQTGAGFDIESENNGGFGLAGVGMTHFFLNGHSINLELNGLGFLQDNDDAVGANLALIMRWHVLRKQNWSIYVDGGAGLIGTTNSVPSSGSSFNFTPQVGGGATIRISEKQHLMFGLRWHHISNADLYESNPGFDSLMGYVGLNLPF